MKINKTRILRNSIVVVLIFVGSSVMAQNISVDSLLKRIDSVYANARTYQDCGTVTYNLNKRAAHEVIKPFKTVFVRDRLFRFNYYQRKESASWSGFQWDSTGTIRGFKWLKSFTRTDGDFSMMTAKLTGVSGGSAHTIPRLLMPGKISGNHFLKNSKRLSISGMDSLDGQSCIVLAGGKDMKSDIRIWIDEDSLLIRQIKESGQEEITVYHPSINRLIPKVDLIFDAKREAWSVFWKYVWMEWGSAILFILVPRHN